jgi:hypothetical protein
MVPTMAPEYFLYEKGFRDLGRVGGGGDLPAAAAARLVRRRADRPRPRRHDAPLSVDYLATRAQDGLLACGLGDWNGYGNDPRTPVAVTDTGVVVRGRCRRSRRCSRLVETTRRRAPDERDPAANRARRLPRRLPRLRVVAASRRRLACRRRRARSHLGLVEPVGGGRVFAQLVADLEAHDFAISCGEVGHPSLLRALREPRPLRPDLEPPPPERAAAGLRLQVARGETTLAETWRRRPSRTTTS